MTQVETSKDAARRLFEHFTREGYKPAGLYAYQGADGAEIYCKARLDPPPGSGRRKEIRPFHLNGSGYQLGEPRWGDRLKPLYRLPEIVKADPSVPVWYVEGEKCVNALARRGLLATTGGGALADERTDYGPLKGRRVILWPDNDAPGREHMQRVALRLRALGCTVQTVDITSLGLPERGDAFDYLVARPDATADDLMALARISEPREIGTDLAPIAAYQVELVRGDRVSIEPVRWIWPGWLAAGKLHVLAGAPGCGKTTLALAWAATMTCAGRWPDGSQAQPGSVLIWSGEDSAADTLAPRLLAMGADLSRVHFVRAVIEGLERVVFDPAQHMQGLSDTAAQIGDVKLLIVDPIVNAVAGDSHKGAEVRRALAPVVVLAERIGCAAVGISHFTKGTAGRDPVERVTGSLAFGALARVVMAAARIKEPDGTERRLLARAKSNIGPDEGGFSYSIELVEVPSHRNVVAAAVRWGEALPGTARELLADVECDAEAGGEVRDAADWLRDLLQGGPCEAKEVERLADAAGFAWRTVQRAKERAGVRPTRDGFGKGAKYWWRLAAMPAKSDPCVPCVPDTELGMHGTHGGKHAPAAQPEAGPEPDREVF